LVAWYPSIDYTRTREARRASNPGGAAKSISQRFTRLFDAAYLWPLDEPGNRTAGSGGDGDSGGSASGSDGITAAAAVDMSRYRHPHLSPSSAPDDALLASLPPTVVLYTCEWDGLYREGEDFRQRLQRLRPPQPSTLSSSTLLASSQTPVDSPAHAMPGGSAASSATEELKPLKVGGRMLPQVRHGWDRSPTFAFRDPGGQRMAMLREVYEEACNELCRAFYPCS
jgi:acetyl esterase/lipase